MSVALSYVCDSPTCEHVSSDGDRWLHVTVRALGHEEQGAAELWCCSPECVSRVFAAKPDEPDAVAA